MSENTLNQQAVQAKEENKVLVQAKRVILALQHLIAMFGATVLVPILTGINPSVALVCAGVGTLIFHQVTKKKVPVFLGSSFAFIAVINTVKDAYGGDLRYAQGGIIVAGLIYVLASFVVKRIGMDKIKKLLPAHVIGPMIVVIGFNLIPTAFNMASENFMIAGITLAVALCMNIFAKGFAKQLSILTGVTVGYGISLVMNLVNTAAITDAALVAMPAFTLPKFDAAAIAIIAPVVLAVFMEHLGDITTNGAVVGQNFIEDPGLNRTLLGDGLATLFAGMVGGPANTTYGENTGVLAMTKNYDPSILRLAAVFAIALGFIGKLGGVLTSIPTFVMGGISFMLFTMIALVGIKQIINIDFKAEKKVDVKVDATFLNVIIMVAIVFLGLCGTYLKLDLGIELTDMVSISGLSLAALVGVGLNAILNIALPKLLKK